MNRTHSLIALTLFLALAPAGALAQDDDAPAQEPVKGCVLHPSPDCRYFGVTDFGVAVGPRRNDGDSYNQDEIFRRMILEGGVMRTFMGKNAAGVTYYFAFDQGEIMTGPGGRYRRWLTTRQSLDVELSVPVSNSTFKSGSVLGLVRYSPDPFIGLSIRPERLKYSSYMCDRTGCHDVTFGDTRVLVGGDLSGKPGGVLLSAYGVAVVVMLVVLSVALSGG